MSKLYEIANEYAELENSGLEPEFIADTLEGLKGTFEDKVENVLKLIKNEQAYSESLKQEAKSFSERARAVDNKIESMKQYLVSSIETAGLKSVRAGTMAVTLRAPSRSVEVTDVSKIPTEYVDFETVTTPDKLAIKKLLEAGQAVPGCELKTGKPSLLIK
ncbi:siphovirus Gp157 family protein [Leclercia sp.]|uniref:siphovirus Gp157 family protein n=1 Tax=Leclercia sp. TaxID=1898428 RepID=UPI0028B195AF|nr:siphovirus Gp157 family protein [Leclercia sp.]